MGVNLSQRIKAAVNAVNYLLWPPRCDLCGRYVSEDDGQICRVCWQNFAEAAADDYCPGCGQSVSQYSVLNGKCPQCEDIDFAFEKIVRVGSYSGALRDMVLSIKHCQSPEFIKLAGYFLYCAVQNKLPLSQIDMFIPVPLHWRRRLSRGYNQAGGITRYFSSHGCKVALPLRRVRYSYPQSVIDIRKRRANVANAFRCRHIASLNGATVCLIDDIKTTGCTLDECAKALRLAGAAKVYAAVIAVTPLKIKP